MKQNRKWYVAMTDSFLSGWGGAEGRIAKLVFECDSYEQAEIVGENANNRSDMKFVNILSKKPYYSKERYQVSYKTPEEAGRWYERGAFK